MHKLLPLNNDIVVKWQWYVYVIIKQLLVHGLEPWQIICTSSSSCHSAVYDLPHINIVHKLLPLDDNVHVPPPLDKKVHKLLGLGIQVAQGWQLLDDHVCLCTPQATTV